MPTAIGINKDGEWEVFDYDNVINKYVIEDFDTASDAVDSLVEVAVYDNTYEEVLDDE